MTYEVIFDVSQGLPQLAVGVVAAVALAVVVAAGLWDTDALIGWWALVIGVGATCVAVQWIVAGRWPWLLAGAVVAGIIVILARVGPSGTGPGRRLPRGAGFLVIGLFLLVLAAFSGLPMVAAIELDRRLAAGEATIIEGPVTIEAFVKTECLVVDGQRFCYSESSISPGYSRQRYINGPLETGLHVRLSVIDGLIVRLEVARDAPGTVNTPSNAAATP